MPKYPLRSTACVIQSNQNNPLESVPHCQLFGHEPRKLAGRACIPFHRDFAATPNIANQGVHVTRTDCTSEHHVRHAAPAIPSGAPLLQAGLTCWRVERADRLAPIVDAASYFKLIRAALLHAQHSVLFIG